MDIIIEAQGHPNQAKLIAYYEQRLKRKYGHYPFVKTALVKVDVEKRLVTKVALSITVEKAGKLYASHTDANENRALEGVIKKVNVLIEKYKQKHYSNSIGK